MFIREHKVWSELIWWACTAVIALLILYPIHYYKIDYPFYTSNIVFIFGFFIFVRWVLLWHLTPYARWQWLKLVIIFTLIPSLYFLSYDFTEFKDYIDDVGIQDMVRDLEQRDQMAMSSYIRSEMIFFSSCTLICGFLVPFKLIWNIWKQHNLGEV